MPSAREILNGPITFRHDFVFFMFLKTKTLGNGFMCVLLGSLWENND